MALEKMLNCNNYNVGYNTHRNVNTFLDHGANLKIDCMSMVIK